MTFITTAILFGLVGNLHCIGMCGPIAFLLPIGERSTASKLYGISLYNIGRVLTYAIFGLLFGLFGQGLNIGAFQQVASIAFGVLILFWVFVPMVTHKFSNVSSRLYQFQSFVKAKLSKQLKRKSNLSLFVFGILNGLLPCGLIYLALAGAIATGSSLEGSIFMMFFGLGTLPAMFIIPFFAGQIQSKFKRTAQRAMPILLTLMALVFIVRGLNLGIPYLSPKFSDDNSTVVSCCSHEGTKLNSISCH